MSSLKFLASMALIFAAAVLPVVAQPDQKLKGSATIAGQITVGGKPAAGIAIAAFTVETFRSRTPAAQTMTDSEGRYLLPGLAPGQYQVASMTPNFPNTETGDPSFMFLYGSSKTILLSSGEKADGVDLKLSRGGVITGRVTD